MTALKTWRWPRYQIAQPLTVDAVSRPRMRAVDRLRPEAAFDADFLAAALYCVDRLGEGSSAVMQRCAHRYATPSRDVS
jgi:hypothetical protein